MENAWKQHCIKDAVKAYLLEKEEREERNRVQIDIACARLGNVEEIGNNLENLKLEKQHWKGEIGEREMREIVSAKESDCLILSRVAALKENLYQAQFHHHRGMSTSKCHKSAFLQEINIHRMIKQGLYRKYSFISSIYRVSMVLWFIIGLEIIIQETLAKQLKYRCFV